MRSNCWAFLMASSSYWGKVDDTSLAITRMSDLRNQSRHCSLEVSSLHKMCRRCYSWMWSTIWIEVVCLNSERSSKPVSWWTGNWKKDKKTLANDSKVTWDTDFSSTYHLVDEPVTVHWNNLKRMESSMMLFKDHHKCKVITWLAGFPSVYLQTLEYLKAIL